MIGESFIPQSFHPQLAQVFARFEHPVRIVTRYDQSDLGKDLQKFSSELAALTDKIAVSLKEAADIPGMELFFHDGRAAGIIYHALPNGQEFNSFIAALYNIAGPGKVIDAEAEKKAKTITSKKAIKIIVTLSCHNCPVVVQAMQRMASLNDNISVEIFDYAHFADLKDKYNLKGVPCCIINEEDERKFIYGKKEFSELLAELLDMK